MPILGLEIFFMAFGTFVKAYIIPELLSTLIGILVIRDLANNPSIIYLSGSTLQTILLPDYLLIIMVFLTLFPIFFIIMRMRGSE